MGEIEPALEVPLELGFPIWVGEVDPVVSLTLALDLVPDDARSNPANSATAQKSSAGSLASGMMIGEAAAVAVVGARDGEFDFVGVGDHVARARECVHRSHLERRFL